MSKIEEKKLNELFECLNEKTSDQRINCHVTSQFLGFLEDKFPEFDEKRFSINNNQWLFNNDLVQEFIDYCKKSDIQEDIIKKILDISNNRSDDPYSTLNILTKGRKRLNEYNFEKYLKKDNKMFDK